MRTILYLVVAITIVGTLGSANATVAVAGEEDFGDSPLDHPGPGAETARCTATTPQVVCVNGAHVRNTLSMSHGFTGVIGPTYTGTAESTLQWISQAGATGSRNFACTFQNGVIRSCAGSGTFPPVGAVFAHVCKSYDAGTTMPGGSGDWGCFLSHG